LYITILIIVTPSLLSVVGLISQSQKYVISDISLIVSGVCLVVAGSLVAAAMKGIRIGERDAACANCWYDIHARADSRCPECGSDLTAPKSIASVRQMRKASVMFGLFVTLYGLIVITIGVKGLI